MKIFKFPGILTLFTIFFMLNLVNSTSCSQPKDAPAVLKDAYKGKFLVGTALNGFQIMETDSLSAPLIDQHFNSITPENCMKWERIHPEPGAYDFELVDKFIELGMEREMYIVGHTLVWHSQTPRWVFLDDEGNLTTRDTLLM
ncbi:MAG: endo-1,4-beta-xylanase, partial [Bacteroidales bacterium]|nr:endo-1,4-beta-xylanase [Bacteroidales bacterium]